MQIPFDRTQVAAFENADDQGVTSYLEVLETERQLFNVELQRSQATQEYYNSYVDLYKALGGGWISEEAMNTYQDTEINSQTTEK